MNRSPEERRRAEILDQVGCWIGIVWSSIVWLGGAHVAAMVLPMSVRGRLAGGPFMNAAWTVFILVWLAGLTAFIVAMWRWRRVTRRVPLIQFARMPRPSDPAEASVWRWMRAAKWAWLFVAAVLASGVIVGLLRLI